MLTSCAVGAPASATAETLPALPITSKLTVKSTVPSANVTPTASGSYHANPSFPLSVNVVPKLPPDSP